MYWDEHNPPHFHAEYGEYEVLISIQDENVISGWVPPRALKLILEWTHLNKEKLLINWENSKNNQPFQKIPPLQ